MVFVKTSIDCHKVNLLSVKLYTLSIKLSGFYHEFMLKVLYFCVMMLTTLAKTCFYLSEIALQQRKVHLFLSIDLAKFQHYLLLSLYFLKWRFE